MSRISCWFHFIKIRLPRGLRFNLSLFNTSELLIIGETIISICYHFTFEKERLLSQNIYKAIKNIFSAVSEKKMSKELYDTLGNKFLPLIQSLCVYFWGNAIFTYDTFKELCDDLEIKCDSYQNQEIKISAFIELYFAKKLKGIITKYTSFSGDYHLINPNGFGNMSVYFNKLESLARTNQQHCDLLIIEKNNPINPIKLYIDIKTFVTFNSEQCRFSLFHSNIALLQRYIADMPVAIKNYIQKHNISMDDPIYSLYIALLNIKKTNIDKTNVELLHKKFLNMLELIVQAFVNPELQKLKLSFAIDAGKNMEYLEFYNKIVVPNLNKIEENREIIHKLLPNTNKINNEEHITTIKDTIEKILPSEIKDACLEYFEDIIVPKIKL